MLSGSYEQIQFYGSVKCDSSDNRHTILPACLLLIHIEPKWYCQNSYYPACSNHNGLITYSLVQTISGHAHHREVFFLFLYEMIYKSQPTSDDNNNSNKNKNNNNNSCSDDLIASSETNYDWGFLFFIMIVLSQEILFLDPLQE